MRGYLVALVQFLINVVISSIVVGIAQQILNLNTYQAIILGGVLFVCILAIQIDYRISRISEVSQKIYSQQGEWDEIHENVSRLMGIQNNLQTVNSKLQEISEGLKLITIRQNTEENLFIYWYNDKLDTLKDHINHTIETQSFYFDTSLLKEQDRIFNIFKGRDTDYHWATASCKGIEWFLTTSGDIFLRAIDTKLKAGQIKSVKRLFIFDTESELYDFNTLLCFFLHEKSGFEFRVMNRGDFEAIFRGFGNRSLVVDFGLYGTHFVWETPPEEKYIIHYGEVCVNKIKMNLYKQLYEHLWSQATPHKIANQDIIEKYNIYRIDSFRRLVLAANTKKTLI